MSSSLPIPLSEAAKALGCSREHLMRLARRGEVQGAKVGRENDPVASCWAGYHELEFDEQS